MTASPGVQRVCDLLEEAGCRRIPSELRVAGVEFSFPAALARNLDLVIVANTVEQAEGELTREIEALAEALDVAGSKLALSLVVVGPRPTQRTMSNLGSCCRVLPVGTATRSDADALMQHLAVFMPLTLPEPSPLSRDPVAELAAAFDADDVLVARLIEASRTSADTVQETLLNLVAEAYEDGAT